MLTVSQSVNGSAANVDVEHLLMSQACLTIMTDRPQTTAVARDSLLCRYQHHNTAIEPTAITRATLQEYKADKWHQKLIYKLMVFSRLSSLAQDALSAEHETGLTEWLSQQDFVQRVGCPAAQLCLFCIPKHASSMHANRSP